MSTKLSALTGAAALLLGSGLLLAPPASAATSAAGSDFIAVLQPVSANKVTGSGEIWVTLTGNSAKFTLQVSGLLAGAPHAAHIYATAGGKCPPDDPAAEPDGHSPVSLADADLGAVGASLTTTGGTSASSALALARYPMAGDYTYSRSFDLEPSVATAIRTGTAVLVVHGIDYNSSGSYDSVLGTVDGAPAEATDPALCGAFVAAQMEITPVGSANTGGGSAAAVSRPGLVGLGLAALLGAGGAGLIALRRRSATPSIEVVVTNGFRRMIR